MDASKLIDAAGIEPLSLAEIEQVSGGKMNQTPVTGQLLAFANGGPFPTMPPQIYQTDLTLLQWATLNGGGRFHYADGLIAIMRADGSQIEVEVIEE